MNTEDSEFERIEAEAKRQAAQPPLPEERNFCPRCGHVCSQRPWQGLTDEDWEKVANRKNTVLDTFEQGATWAAYKLERCNT